MTIQTSSIMVKVLKAHLVNRPLSSLTIYRLQVEEEHLGIIKEATSLYWTFFCGRFNEISVILKTEGRCLDIAAEMELLQDLKVAFSPELRLYEFYDIYSANVTGLTKMAYDIHTCVINKPALQLSRQSKLYKSIKSASSEIAPVIVRLIDDSNNVYYQLDLSDRLFFALSKTLHLYEAILSGNIRLISDLATINGYHENRIIGLRKALVAFQTAYFEGQPSLNLSENAKIAAKLRSVIEKHHPELHGIAEEESIPEEDEQFWQTEKHPVEIEEEIIRPQEIKRKAESESNFQFFRTRSKWFIPVVVSFCLIVITVSYFIGNKNSNNESGTAQRQESNADTQSASASNIGKVPSGGDINYFLIHKSGPQDYAIGTQTTSQDKDSVDLKGATWSSINKAPSGGSINLIFIDQSGSQEYAIGTQTTPDENNTAEVKNATAPIGTQATSEEMHTAEAKDAIAYSIGKTAYVQSDYASENKELNAATEQSNASAQILIGHMYRKGKGVTKDYLEAFKWFQKSADQIDKYDENQFGQVYEKLKGVTQDDAEADKGFRKAAEQGNVTAQFMFGHIYREGKGVTKDDEALTCELFDRNVSLLAILVSETWNFAK
jgi:hypothetical protein